MVSSLFAQFAQLDTLTLSTYLDLRETPEYSQTPQR